MKKIISTFLFLFCFASFVFSQNKKINSTEANTSESANEITLTLEDALKFAKSHASEFRASDIDLEIKKRARLHSWNVFLPTANASASLSRANEVQQMSFPPVKETESLHWTFVGNIGFGINLSLAYIGQIKAAYADYEAGLLSYEQSIRKTTANVKKMFYAILIQQENLRLQKTNLENARKRLEQAQINYRNGLIPEIKLLQVQVQYENQKPQLVQAEMNVEQQLDMFAFIIGMSSGSHIKLSGNINPTFAEVDADELIEKYLNDTVEVKSIDKNIEVMKQNLLALNFASYSPVLSFNWNYQPMKSDIFNKDNDAKFFDRGALTATLAIDIMKMLPFSSQRKQAADLKSNIEKLEISRYQLAENQKLSVRTAVNKLMQAKQQLDSVNANVSLAERSYTMTLRSYENGATELLDLRDSENQLLQAQLGLANQKYNYISALLDLEGILNADLTSYIEKEAE